MFSEVFSHYRITACVTQDNYPPKEFEFIVTVEPEFREKIVPVYEEAGPEDVDPEVLKRRIEEFGKTESDKK